jgi:hypothetical protein
MFYRRIAVGLFLPLCCMVAAGKNKKKVILPTDVLQAQTVLVVIEPGAGETIDAPMANRIARDDVEKALMNWGRFRMAVNASDADLIISVRKGSGRVAQPTIGGVPDNNRPVILQPSDSGGRVGGQTGAPPPLSNPTTSEPRPQGPYPQAEVGESDDMFTVYRGKRDNPLDSPPVWRYAARDGLRSPSVPAVGEFRKTIVEAEKQQANNP